MFPHKGVVRPSESFRLSLETRFIQGYAKVLGQGPNGLHTQTLESGELSESPLQGKQSRLEEGKPCIFQRGVENIIPPILPLGNKIPGGSTWSQKLFPPSPLVWIHGLASLDLRVLGAHPRDHVGDDFSTLHGPKVGPLLDRRGSLLHVEVYDGGEAHTNLVEPIIRFVGAYGSQQRNHPNMTDTAIAPTPVTRNPLEWAAAASPTDNDAKILIENRLTNPEKLAKANPQLLVQIGLPLGFVMDIQTVAMQACGLDNPIPSPTTSTPPPAAITPTSTAIPLPASPAPVAALTTPVAPVAPIPMGVPMANPAGPMNFVISEQTNGQKIRQHLIGLAANEMESRTELQELGVKFVVAGPNNLPLVEPTLEMRAQLGNVAPEGGFWMDNPVVSIHDVGMINFRSPVNLTVLQGGMDAQSGVPWGKLGLDRLILARCVYVNNLHGGASEQMVYDDMLTGGRMAQRASTRISANSSLRALYEGQVAPRTMVGNPVDTGVARAPRPRSNTAKELLAPVRGSGKRVTADRTTAFQHLLTSAFPESRAMRSFGQDLGVPVPSETASRSELAFAIASELGNRGLLENAINDIARQFPVLEDDAKRVALALDFRLA